MRCREFQDKHLSFVDDTLPAVEMEAMRDHMERCAPCARRDTAIRRSLMLARSLPRVECSGDFGMRLEARIRALGPVNRSAPLATPRGFSAAGFSVLAAGVIGVAALAGFLMVERPAEPVRMAPVVASLPEPEPAPMEPAVVTPVYVASFISGMPVWPAVMAAGSASVRAANVELRQASLRDDERP